MKTSLADRVARIVSGSLNQLVASMENAVPETVMEEAIREVEGAIEDTRAELGREEAKRHLAGKRLADANSRHEDLSGKLDLAITQKRDDLAEAAIAQQLDLEAQIPILEGTIREAGERRKELEGFIGALQAKKREMQAELRELRAAKAAARQAGTGGEKAGAEARPDARSRAERAQSVFDRVLESQTGVPGASPDLASAGKLAELDRMSRQDEIRRRLEAAKSRTAKS